MCKHRRPHSFVFSVVVAPHLNCPRVLLLPVSLIRRRGQRRGRAARSPRGQLRERVLLRRVRDFPELREHRVYVLERLVDVLALLPTREDDLPADENQEHNLRDDHAVYQTREQLRFVLREVPVRPREAFEANRKLHVARADHVLNLKLLKLRREPQLRDDLRVLPRRFSRERLGLRARAHHLPAAEYERGRLRRSDAHDRRGETLRVVLHVARVEGDRLQVELAVQVNGRDDVL
mmetsp:Transcript_60436/g.145961  ORF Transcript_60436/g.145961 Transcript_60436/m.145961 type:complete len:235 (+) Transcript_60436:123-827(+)